MGQACGSADDSATPSGDHKPMKESKPKQKKLTSLDDIIKTNQRKSSEIKITASEKKKLFDRKFSIQKDQIRKIR